MHDLVIENARLVDGLGTPARDGGLAVKDGRIAAVGADLGAAKQRVDAAGQVLAVVESLELERLRFEYRSAAEEVRRAEQNVRQLASARAGAVSDQQLQDEQTLLAQHSRSLALAQKLSPRLEPALDRLQRRPAEQGKALAFSLAAHGGEPCIEVDIVEIEADQLAHAQAGRVQDFEDRPIAQAERMIRRGRLQQRVERIFRQKMRQVLVLPRCPQSFGRVHAHLSLAAQELEPGTHGGNAACNRRLGVCLLVQPNRECS